MAIISQTEFNAVQSRLARVYEIGDGDYGYGQVALSQPIGISASLLDLQNLRTDILAAKQHQVGALATLPITSIINNEITTSQWGMFNTVLTQVETNRLVTPPAAQASRDLLVSESITAEWNGTTTHLVTVSFTDADAMRNYFNTGSTIEFTAARTAGMSNTKNVSWSSLLTNIGIVSFKRNATSSTKAVGTSIGYSKLTDSEQVIFQKVTTDTLKPNTYRIYAYKPDDTTINFRVEFIDGSTSLSDPNVSGNLTSNVNAFHASGVFVSVPAPEITSSEMEAGAANPTFAIVRDANSIGEGETGVTFTVNTLNFTGDKLYWLVKGYGITASDFVENTLTGEFDVLNNVGTFSLTASSDLYTEGTEKFVVEIRIDPAAAAVASISGSPETITDLSLTQPIVISNPTYNFVAQSVSSVPEGQTISYTIVTTNVADGTDLAWSTKGLTAGITAADFEDNTLNGIVTIYNNTATIDRTLINDNAVEAVESFQLVLSTIDSKTGIKKPVVTSYLMQVIDTVVAAVDVPYLATSSLTTVPEGSVLGVNFKLTTPKLPLGTRVYWQTFADTGEMTGTDFNDGLLSGTVIVVNQVATVSRYIKSDGVTEGLESFHITFYSDSAMTEELVQSPTVSITESVKYSMTKDVSTMSEGGLGINYTVNTPYLDNGTILYYTVVSEAGTVDSDDLVNGLTGTFTINNNVGKILIRANADNVVEGNEQFHLDIRETDGTSGPILVSSQSATITEPEVYDILSQRSAINEGEIGVEFIIKTPKVPNGTVMYWSTVTDTGTITASDFTDNTLSGTVTITNNTGSITRTAAADSLTEGDESFHLVLRTGSASGTQVKVGDPVTISEYVKYSIAPGTQAITEGNQGVQFNITTPKVTNGTFVYWTILPGTGNITETDFIVSDAQGGSAQRMSGKVAIQSNRGSFIIAARPDSLTEGNESFQVELRLDDIDGPVQDTTRSITISEVVQYEVIASVQTATEGPTSVTFTVNTPNMTDGDLYWTTYTASGTVNGSDFTDGVTQGTVAITGNTGSIIRTIAADTTTEGVDAFAIQLRLTGYGSPVVKTSNVVVIQDTSVAIEVPEPEAPTYSVSQSGTSVTKGNTIVFTVHTTNVTNSTNLFWTLFRGPGVQMTDFDHSVSPAAVHVTYNDGSTSAAGTVEVPIQVLSNSATQGVRSFMFELRTGSVYGPVVATSQTAVTIIDEVKYSITPTTRSIAEGAGIVTFNVITPPAAIGTTIEWAVVANTGTITTEDFADDAGDPISSLNGNVSITSDNNGANGKGLITFKARTDDTTEGNETFHVELNTNPVTVSSIVTISEVVEYILSSDTNSISEGGSGVTFTLNTPKLKTDTTFTYTISGKKGQLSASDFVTTQGGSTTLSSLSGTVTVSALTNSGSFTLYAGTDTSTEGEESFVISSLTSPTGQSISLGGQGSPEVKITETVEYTIVPTVSELSTIPATSFVEGSTVYFKVTTPKMDDGLLYWVIEPDPSSSQINLEDFTDKKMSGPVQITKNKGTFNITHAPDSITEGSESYHVILKRDSIDGLEVKTSATITVSENPQYSVTTDVPSIAEGGTVTFTVNTPYSDNGATLSWVIDSSTMTNADFSVASGDKTVADNKIEIPVTAVTDLQSETGNSFTIKVRKNGVLITPLVGVIPTITVTDSNSYQIVPKNNQTTLSEGGDALEFTVYTPGSSTEKTLYWSIQGEEGTVDDKDFQTAKGTVTIGSNHTGTFSVKAVEDTKANEGDKFTIVLRSGSQTGNIITVQNTPVITILDKEFYTISADRQSIDEGGTGVVFTITTPTSKKDSTLYWKIVGSQQTSDFQSQKLSGAIASNGTITRNMEAIVAANDSTTEGKESFTISIAESPNGTPVKFVAACPVITINDTSIKGKPITQSVALTVQSQPTSIAELNNGEFVVRVTPTVDASVYTLTTMDVNWEIVNTAKNTQASLSTSATDTVVSKGVIKTVIDPTSPTISEAKLKLFVRQLPTNALTSACQVQFTITDPVTKNKTSKTSASVKILYSDVDEEPLYSTQEWKKPAGVEFVQITMCGGGGQGGGAGASLDGGPGGFAAGVVGVLDVTNITSLHFEFVPGSASLYGGDNDKDADDVYDWGGIGGTGGSGIILRLNSKTATPWVTVGGAGGGGAGRVNGIAIGGTGSSSVQEGGKYSANMIAKGGKVTGGDGGAGGCGGTLTSQPYLDYPNAVSRVGGGAGITYVPAASGFVYDPAGGGQGGDGVKLIRKTPKAGNYAKTSYMVGKTEMVLNSAFIAYNIGLDDDSPSKINEPMFVTWTDVNLPQGDYILDIYTDGYGAMVINDKYYNGDKVITHNFTLESNWNKRISLSYQWFKNSKNLCGTEGIAATIRPVGAPNSQSGYVWTTRSTTNVWMRPHRGAGDTGEPAMVFISYGPSVTGENAVKPVIGKTITYPTVAKASLPSTYVVTSMSISREISIWKAHNAAIKKLTGKNSAGAVWMIKYLKKKI